MLLKQLYLMFLLNKNNLFGNFICKKGTIHKCWNVAHCWKKKRNFLIICSKVGGFLIQSVADNEYFVG